MPTALCDDPGAFLGLGAPICIFAGVTHRSPDERQNDADTWMRWYNIDQPNSMEPSFDKAHIGR